MPADPSPAPGSPARRTQSAPTPRPKRAALPLSFPASLLAETDRHARLHHTSRNAFILRATRALLRALSLQQRQS